MKKNIGYIMLFIMATMCICILTTQFRNTYGKGYETYTTFFSYEQLKVERPTSIAISQTQGYIEKYVGEAVEIIGTEAGYTAAEALPMERGIFLPEKSVQIGENVAVISDVLAHKLFQSDQIQGNVCKINGIYYEIIGVYKHQATFWEYFQKDTSNRIYVPITSDVVKRVPLSCYMKETKENIEGILGNYEHLMIFVLGIGVIVILCSALVKRGKQLLRRYKELGKSYYFMKRIGMLLKLGWKDWLVSSMLIIISIKIMQFVSFDLTIPLAYIPEESILDLSFYWNVYLARKIELEEHIRGGIPCFYMTYRQMINSFRVLVILQMVSIWHLLKMIKSLKIFK